jgi:hypothetical protein
MTDENVLNDNPEEQDLLLRLAALPQEAEPARDLWPGIAARIRFLIQAAAALLLFTSGVAVGHRWGSGPEPAPPVSSIRPVPPFRPVPSMAREAVGGNTTAVVAGVAGRCPEGHPESGDLGIGALLCVSGSCTINLRSGGGEGGPATGKLQDGDTLLALDGVPITTREGSRRLANLKPGRPVILRIRRGGREKDIVLVPRLGCRMPTLAIPRSR